ncbi:ferric-dicitrate binding protein FerR, regulates iron transport through sigma-19 [Parapedobacter composti]|uniref:Ferric-dicitrate binding protein FerR, regulates iron transport through sigma-19 n=1 Tax=Parapedobacter composti TaxID=623281 RepID=A0A1I1I9A5_9SPHI|nr:FecR family protein [Parapedobacter composti]SFC32332.1 ferric-dicitrate binding protein FerR, regulates iron transport through sigma-19 [Parapedobacter composti]
MMEHRKAFEQLIDRYLQGLPLTDTEQALLESYFDSFENKGAILDELSEEDVAAIDRQLRKAIFERSTRLPNNTAKKQSASAPVKYKYIGLAASLLMTLGLAYFYINQQNSAHQLNHDIVRYDGKSFSNNDGVGQFLLPDGSLVFLNQGSKLQLAADFGSENRHANLEGEAYFDVTHNPDKPFIVYSKGTAVRVLGTTFLVKETDSAQSVALLSGKVQLANSVEAFTLRPGELADRSKDATTFTVSKADFNELLNWKPATFQLNDITMADMADFMTKRYGIQLEFESDKIRECHITISLNGRETWEELLDIVSLVNQFTYEQHGTRITLTGRGCLP